MENARCENCGDTMRVRSSDVNRGWGRFCSKSCKAKKQTRRERVEKNLMIPQAQDFEGGAE